MGFNNALRLVDNGLDPADHLALLQYRLLDAMEGGCNTQELPGLALPSRLRWRGIWAGAKCQANVATKREGMQIGFACAGVSV